ncbi:MAG: glycosyltransferase [bacterium]|jgi:rhamnosyl/mannosyltransferase|nr:glycosyltransferase [bacterium]
MNRQKQPHILMLNKAYPPWVGGIERHVCDVSEELVRRGWRVSVLVCHEGRQATHEESNRVHVYRCPRWATVLSQPIVTGYLKKIKALQPDLVHVHLPFPLGWLAPGWIDAKVPVVCTWHSDIVRQAFLRPFFAPLERWFLRRCARILPTSEPLRAGTVALWDFEEKCQVIPLAIHATPPPNEAERASVQAIRLRWPGKIVLFVGRLVSYKGLAYLINAMAQVEGHLLLAGDGALREPLETLAGETARDRIHFLGPVSEEEKLALYRAADVFVLPSVERNEAFGYVLLEAMQEGCPVISTALPTGVCYVNQHEETGLVVPPRDAVALARAIQRILFEVGLRDRLSLQARERIQTEFSFPHVMDQVEAVYRECLGSMG